MTYKCLCFKSNFNYVVSATILLTAIKENNQIIIYNYGLKIFGSFFFEYYQQIRS